MPLAPRLPGGRERPQSHRSTQNRGERRTSSLRLPPQSRALWKDEDFPTDFLGFWRSTPLMPLLPPPEPPSKKGERRWEREKCFAKFGCGSLGLHWVCVLALSRQQRRQAKNSGGGKGRRSGLGAVRGTERRMRSSMERGGGKERASSSIKSLPVHQLRVSGFGRASSLLISVGTAP